MQNSVKPPAFTPEPPKPGGFGGSVAHGRNETRPLYRKDSVNRPPLPEIGVKWGKPPSISKSLYLRRSIFRFSLSPKREQRDP